MRAKQRAVRVRGDVHDAEAAGPGRRGDLQAVGGDRARGDGGFVLRLEEKIGEIGGPHAQEPVVRRGDGETLRDPQVVDAVVVQLKHALELPLAVVDLNHGARDGGDEYFFLVEIRYAVPDFKRQRRKVVQFEVVPAVELRRLGRQLRQLEVPEVHAAPAELTLAQPVRANGVLAARHDVVLLEGRKLDAVDVVVGAVPEGHRREPPAHRPPDVPHRDHLPPARVRPRGDHRASTRGHVEGFETRRVRVQRRHLRAPLRDVPNLDERMPSPLPGDEHAPVPGEAGQVDPVGVAEQVMLRARSHVVQRDERVDRIRHRVAIRTPRDGARKLSGEANRAGQRAAGGASSEPARAPAKGALAPSIAYGMPVSASTSLTAPDTGRDDDRSPPAPPSPKKPTSEGCARRGAFTRRRRSSRPRLAPADVTSGRSTGGIPLAGGDGGWSRDASSWPTRGGDDGRVVDVFLSFVFAASSSKTGRRSLGVALRASIVASSCVAYGVVGMFVACGTATIGADVGSSASSSAASSGGWPCWWVPPRGGASGRSRPGVWTAPPDAFGSTPPTRCHATSTPGFDERCISLGNVSAS